MNDSSKISTSETSRDLIHSSENGSGIFRAVIQDADLDGQLLVEDQKTGQRMSCVPLLNSALGLTSYSIGDQVLIWFDDQDSQGVVLGSLGSPLSMILGEQMRKQKLGADVGADAATGTPALNLSKSQQPSETAPQPTEIGLETLEHDAVPDELVIEAKKRLTLKCGDGSITIQADGKILIKGKDLVSRAARTNRVSGGSVAIN